MMSELSNPRNPEESRKMPWLRRAVGGVALTLCAGLAGAGAAYKDEIERQITPKIEFNISDPFIKSLISAEQDEQVDYATQIEIPPITTEFLAIEEPAQKPLAGNVFIDGFN